MLIFDPKQKTIQIGSWSLGGKKLRLYRSGLDEHYTNFLTQEYNKYQHNLPSRFVSDTLLIYINQCSSLGQLKDQFNLIQSIHLIQTVPIFA